jgi:hypothetical protein
MSIKRGCMILDARFSLTRRPILTHRGHASTESTNGHPPPPSLSLTPIPTTLLLFYTVGCSYAGRSGRSADQPRPQQGTQFFRAVNLCASQQCPHEKALRPDYSARSQSVQERVYGVALVMHPAGGRVVDGIWGAGEAGATVRVDPRSKSRPCWVRVRQPARPSNKVASAADVMQASPNT